jgi:hypothetical protein
MFWASKYTQTLKGYLRGTKRCLMVCLASLLASIGCSSESGLQEGETQTTPQGATVTILQSAPENGSGAPADYRSPTRIGALEGIPVEDARARAIAAGWVTVLVSPAGEPPPVRPSIYDAKSIGLYTLDDVVVEAWTGGYSIELSAE